MKTKFHELNSCCRAKKMFAGELRSIFSHLSFLYVVITSLTLHILVVVKFVYPCPTLCDPTDSGFSRPEYWNGQLFPSPGDLPNPGTESRSPTLQTDSIPAEPPRKPKNTGVGSLSLLQWIIPTQELNRSLLQCRRILYQLSQ